MHIGYIPINLENLNENLNKFDIIFNTVPSILLNEENIKLINKKCVIIELASYPGGVDKQIALDCNIKVVEALGLPGKVAPETSAKYIKQIILPLLNKNKN